MVNPEHLTKLKEGVERWNQWRKEYPDVQPDLTLADLRGMDLSKANLRWAKLDRAQLAGAHLKECDLWRAYLVQANLGAADLSSAFAIGAHFGRASLRDANLSDAVLRNASFRDADLRSADLSNADLVGSNLFQADCDHVRFHGAKMGGTHLSWTSCRSVTGLESVTHEGPSTIGFEMVHIYHHEFPESFFRGMGVPQALISFARSFTPHPVDFHSCFISYSTSDEDFAHRLYADLQDNNVRCWFAPHDIRAGRKLHEQIDQAIRVHDRMLLILSEPSMASEWVRTEIAYARQKESIEKRKVLFPISVVPFSKIREWKCFDPDTGKDSAREIREYFIPDFSTWKEDYSYKEAFQRLLQDLRADEEKADING